MNFPSASIVICTYTDKRHALLSEAISAVLAQLTERDELLVVVDHNDALLARLQPDSRFRTLANAEGRGLSGARNTGVAGATRDVVVFLDDDATPGPGWLDQLRAAFDAPDVAGVGGLVRPRWERGRPRWFPPELDWVVGCSYVGQQVGDVRNPIGANMAFRRSALDRAGGFRSALGRVGARPLGCEETELGLRVQALGLGRCVVVEAAPVDHFVPGERSRARYLFSRCYAEGRSKAVVAVLADVHASVEDGHRRRDTLAPERRYLWTLLGGMARSLQLALARRQPAVAVRAAVIPAGAATAAAGYLRGRIAGEGVAA